MSDGIVTQLGMFGGAGESPLLDSLEEWWENANVTGAHRSTPMGAVPGPTVSGTGNGMDAWDLDGTNCVAGINGTGVRPNDLQFTIAFVVFWEFSATNSYLIQSAGNTVNCRFQTGVPGLEFASVAGAGFFSAATVGAWYSVVMAVGEGVFSPFLNGVHLGSGSTGSLPSSWFSLFRHSTYIISAFAVASRAWNADDAAAFHNGGNFLTYADL